MNTSRRRTNNLLAVVATVLALSACDVQAPDLSTDGNNDATTTATEKTLPDFVGKGLQTAQDEAQAAGFRILTSHDSTGQGRQQVLDRNWKVCFQTPAANTTTKTDATIDFGAAPVDEQCPAQDSGSGGGVSTAARETMPDVTGKSLLSAQQTLGISTSLSIEDATGQGRVAVIPTNWKVCSSTPAAGEAFNGVPVTVRIVKDDETCP